MSKNKNTKTGCISLAYFVFCGFIFFINSWIGCDMSRSEIQITYRLINHLESSQHFDKAIEHWTAVKQLVAAEKSKEEIVENYDKFWDYLHKIHKTDLSVSYNSKESSATDIIEELKDTDTVPYPYQYKARGMTKEQTDQIDLHVAEFREKLSDEIAHTVSMARATNRSCTSGQGLIMLSGALGMFLCLIAAGFSIWRMSNKKTKKSQNNKKVRLAQITKKYCANRNKNENKNNKQTGNGLKNSKYETNACTNG